MLDIPKFECSACGKCCSKIQGLTSISEKEFIKEYGYGKMPLVQIIPIEEMTFPLWDFEAKRFKKYEKEVRIDAKIRPSRGVLDLNTNKFIVFTYHMNSTACPFLSDKGICKIYDTRRAFICHLFPLNKSPFLNTGEKDSSRMFGNCANVLDIIDKLNYEDKKELINQLYSSFGEIFLAVVQHDFIMEWSNKLLIKLLKEKNIRPAMNYPYGMLLKRVENSEKIDLMDFLVESEYKTREEVDELIKRFEHFEDAKEKVKEFV